MKARSPMSMIAKIACLDVLIWSDRVFEAAGNLKVGSPDHWVQLLVRFPTLGIAFLLVFQLAQLVALESQVARRSLFPQGFGCRVSL